MKCRYLNPQEYVAGFNSENQPIVELKPAGFEVEHPDAWKICIPGYGNSAPIAEPADDECRTRVDLWKKTEGVSGRKMLAYIAATMPDDYEHRAHVEFLVSAHHITKEEMNEAVKERKAIDSQAVSSET